MTCAHAPGRGVVIKSGLPFRLDGIGGRGSPNALLLHVGMRGGAVPSPYPPKNGCKFEGPGAFPRLNLILLQHHNSSYKG